MMRLVCCAVLATDEEFTERETNLNCLRYVSEELDDFLGCFFELGRRDIVARFVSVCRSATKLSLEDRIRSVVGALRDALEMANQLSGETSLEHGSPPIHGCAGVPAWAGACDAVRTASHRACSRASLRSSR